MKPPWIRAAAPQGERYEAVLKKRREGGFRTVCEEALCPNVGECWPRGHATFLVMGPGCTRACAFCGVGKAVEPLDPGEPGRVAEAVRAMGLSHAVITSVTRDDLQDGGAAFLAQVLEAVRRASPGITTEVLAPDFGGNFEALETLLAAGPDIFGHNVETVPGLYPKVRPGADFERSLALLAAAKSMDNGVVTKSGLMAGLGESGGEILETLARLKESSVDVVTVGQYLRPSPRHLPVARYLAPEEFAALGEAARAMGFSWVESGPLVRSSYGSDRQARALCRRER